VAFDQKAAKEPNEHTFVRPDQADQYASKAQYEVAKHSFPVQTPKGTEYRENAQYSLDQPAMAIMNLLKNIPGWIK